MPRSTLPALALALLGLAAPLAAPAVEVLALLPATGVNVDEGTLAATSEVLRNHLARAGLEVRLVQGPGGQQAEASAGEAAAAARSVGAGRAAVVRVVGLGTVLRSRLTVYDAASGALVHDDDMPADTAADLDPALERLATGYARGRSAAAVAELDTVTQKESRPVQRVEAARSSGFRLGMVWPRGSGATGHGTGAGLFWAYDTRDFLVDLAVDGAWGADVKQVTAGFGAAYPFSRTTLAPYAGAGVRYAWVNYGAGGGNGFQPYAAGGVIVGRLSTVSIRLQAEYWWNAFSIRGASPVSGAGLSLGLGF